MNIATFFRGQGTNAIGNISLVCVVSLITIRDRTVNSTYRSTWLVYAENSAAIIAPWMHIVVFCVERIAQVIINGHRLCALSPIKQLAEKIVFIRLR